MNSSRRFSFVSSDNLDGNSLDAEAGRVFDAYLAGLEAGCPADPQDLLARNPRLADRLQACLAMLDWADRLSNGGEIASGLILGDFRVVREIGRGGMGVVYEAEQVSLRRRVALKVLPFAATLDRNQLLRFRIEAQAVAQLHHTNIVPVFAVGHERGVHFYGMQLIEGRSLDVVIQALRRREGLECNGVEERGEDFPAWIDCPSIRHPRYARIIAQLGIQAADALDHAHSLGVVHRDIKPANLLVDIRGNLWVTDFGLARVQAGCGVTVTGDVLGTLRYMSPEQLHASREAVGHRSDLYSLGATLYHLLTLRPIHDCSDRAELVRMMSLREPRPPRQFNRSIPRDLETILMKTLARDPSRRYANARELAEDLRRYLDTRPIHARRPSVWTRSERFIRRHKLGVLTAAAILVNLGIALSVLIHKARESQSIESIERTRRQAEEIRTASDLFSRNRIREAERVLTRGIPKSFEGDIRSFPWFHLWRASSFRPEEWSCHSDSARKDVFQIELSPRDDLMVSCGADGNICLWDTRTGTPRWTRHGHGGEANAVAFSPDGTKFVTCGDDGAVLLWSISDTHPPLLIGKHDSWCCNVKFTPDGRAVLSVSADGRMKIWDISSHAERPFFKEPSPRVQGILVSPDGKHLVTGARDEPARIWEFDSARELPGFPDREKIRSGAFSDDGRLLALVTNDNAIKVWDFVPRKLVSQCRVTGTDIEAIAFSPDNRHIASGDGKGTIQIWDSLSGDLVRNYRGEPTHVWSIQFGRDGRSLISAGSDGMIRRWDLEKIQDISIIDMPKFVIYSMAFRADTDSLLVAGRHVLDDPRHLLVTTWDLDRGVSTGTIRVESPRAINQGKFSQDGNLLCTLEETGQLTLWEIPSGKFVEKCPDPPGMETSYFTPPNGWPPEYNKAPPPAGMRPLYFDCFNIRERYICFSRCSSFSRRCEDTVIWDTLADEIVSRPGGLDLKFRSPTDRKFLAIGDAGVVWWDPATDRVVSAEFPDHVQDIQDLKRSNTGRFLAVRRAKSIALLDGETQKYIEEIRSVDGGCLEMDFSPDDRVLAVLKDNGAVTFWDTTLLKEVCTASNLPFSGGRHFKFSPKGSVLVCGAHVPGSEKTQLVIWHTTASRDPKSREAR